MADPNAKVAQFAGDDHETLSSQDLQRFKQTLEQTRADIVARSRVRVAEALDARTHLPDESDEATNLTAQAFELRLADKDRKLLGLVDHALAKLARGEYGYCEGTDEPISLARLQLRPWARYSVAYKDRLEKERKLHA